MTQKDEFKVDLRNAPYSFREDFNDKDYSMVLFKPGDFVQSSELNDLQDQSFQKLKRVADSIFKDGDISTGCQIIIEDIKDSLKKKITITDGKIYLNGYPRTFKRQTIEITGVGSEAIGVRLKQQIVDYTTDETLKSPAAGYEQYGIPSANRLKETLELRANDDAATTIYLIQDGELVNQKMQDDNNLMDKLYSVLARRTYDESGHYKVSGLELEQKEQYETDKLYLTLSAGKAYVEGWEVEKQTATTIPIDRSTQTRLIQAEPKVFQTGTGKYKINNFPVSRINKLTSPVEVTIDLTRQGALNGTDPIPPEYSPVVEIKSIKQANGTTYTKNVDFILEADNVRWVKGGKQPDLGATYTINFIYNKIMKEGKDYKLAVESGDYYLEFLKGDKPVNSSQIQLDYDFYLYQICSVTIDRLGNIRVIYGQPDTEDRVSPPDITDQKTLILGYVKIAPVNDILKIQNTRSTRSDMARIQKMMERLEDMEVNQAITDLDKEALEGEEPTLLKGVFTDGFLGFTKSDVNHKEYNASIDPINRVLTLGFEQKLHPVSINKDKSGSCSIFDNVITSKAKPVLGDKQPYATEAHRINPYTAFPKVPIIKIHPAVDSWIDTDRITVQKDGGVVVRNNTVRVGDTDRSWGGRWESETYTENGGVTSRTNKTTSTSVLDTAIEYMRQIPIKFEANQFFPGEEGIVVLFNDVEVEVKPDNGYQGTTSTTLRADENGVVKGEFTVPANTRCGVVDVKIYSKQFKQVGSTPFRSEGILKKIITTETTTRIDTYTTVYRTVWRRIPRRNIDPVAQTFMFAEDQVLSKLGLYFASKDNKYDLIVQVRDTDNGYPSANVLAEVIVPYDKVKTSTNSGEETVVEFDNPIYLRADTQYAFTVLTQSPTASIFIETLGRRDLLSNQIVQQNPYIPGLFFTSSNALAWTAEQDKNIKFNLYTTSYESKATVYFNDINGVDYDRIMLQAETSVPVDCKLEWQYSTDGTHWLPIAINKYVKLDKKIQNLTLRAEITTTGNVSPAIAIDSLLFTGSLNNLKSNYVSRNVTTDSEFTSVKIIVDVNAPSGTGVVLYYATDVKGETWNTLTQSGEGKVKEDGGYIEYTYTAESIPKTKNFRVKVAMTTNNSVNLPYVKNLKCILK